MDFYTYSNIGGRDVNEDSCGVSYFGKSFCFVVADGLGGHGGGDVASKCAVERVCELFIEKGYSNTFWDEAFSSVQESILRFQRESCAMDRMKTTLVIAVIDEKYIYSAHVGDSRFYHFKNGRFKTRSLDHSVPQMLALSKDIEDSEIRYHADRNKLMRVLGAINDPPEYEKGTRIRLSGKNAFLLCTDGFWELIEETDMERCLQASRTAKEWVTQMSEIIQRNGAGREMDNYTCIAIISNYNWLGAEV